MGTFTDIKFSLFGSPKNVAFDNRKTLTQNFIAMCSLSTFQKPSRETQKLMDLIEAIDKKIHSLKQNPYGNITDQTRALYDVLNQCIIIWNKIRKSESTRVDEIKNFQKGVINQLKIFNQQVIHQSNTISEKIKKMYEDFTKDKNNFLNNPETYKRTQRENIESIKQQKDRSCLAFFGCGNKRKEVAPNPRKIAYGEF